MKAPMPFPLAMAAVAALAACQARVGNDIESSGSAENKAERGELSINAPGVQMKINIPEGLRREAAIHDESGLVYPGSTMAGVHVEGGSDDRQGESHGEVELRFASTDAPDAVARWYRDPARSAHFTLDSASRAGPAYVFAGSRREGHGRFRVRLMPAAGGGTDGRLLLADEG